MNQNHPSQFPTLTHLGHSITFLTGFHLPLPPTIYSLHTYQLDVFPNENKLLWSAYYPQMASIALK